MVAAGIYVGIWAISKYAVTVQASYYYSVSHKISSYIEVDPNNPACDQNIDTTVVSTSLYSSSDIKTAQAVALSLIFSWLMWKLPLAMFMLHLIY